MKKITPDWIDSVWEEMMIDDVLCPEWRDPERFKDWFSNTGITFRCTFRRYDPRIRLGPGNCDIGIDSYEGRDDPSDVVGADNPAYQQFREMKENVHKLTWIGYCHEDGILEYIMKGTVIATIVPDERGFDLIVPNGPEYEVRDILTPLEDGSLHLHADAYTAIGNIVLPIMDAYEWADSLISDEEWFESG